MNCKSKTIDRCQISKKKDLKRILSLGFLHPVNDFQPINSRKKEEIIVVQIAGLIARRILSFVDLFDSLKIGERFGLIRFGSRVDVYLPSKYNPQVALGQKVVAGESIIASK